MSLARMPRVLLLIFVHCFSCSSSCEASTNCFGSRENYEQQMTYCESIPPVNEPLNATDIVGKLFDKRYDKRLRAGYGGKAVVVDVSLGFLSISEVVERNMEFTAHIYMRELWNDSRLTFANRSTALILQHDALEKLWLPDTFFENAVKTTVQKETRTVVLYGDGLIVFSQRVTVTARTPMHFEAYPMDKQVFVLDLMSYGRDRNQVQYRWHNVSLLNEEMPEFVITSSNTEQTTKRLFIGCFDFLTVKFYAKRRVGFYVIRIFFPCVLCTVVSWMAFWMDCSGVGDRGTVGITSLLTQLFLVGSINEAMPPVSYVKAADEFLIASFAFTFFALLESIVVYKTAASERHKDKGTLFKNKENEIKEQVAATKFRALDSNDMELPSNGIQGKDNERKTGENTVSSFFGEISSKAKFIDRTARVVFPLGYIVFIVSYFLIYMS